MTGFKLMELLNGVFVWLLIDEPVVDAAEQDAVVIPIEVHTWDRGVAAWTVSGSADIGQRTATASIAQVLRR